MRFALNHIAAPGLSLEAFFRMAKALGITEVEIRNDLPDVVGKTDPKQVRDLAGEAGLSIISINALYPFNDWSGDLPDRAAQLADYAKACGARALVMCPLNDGRPVAFDALVAALKALEPLLADRGLIGLVEPLGFTVSSLRTKRAAVDAIQAAGGEATFKLVHDTFQHHLAGETEFFPEWTGLAHISGVADREVSVDGMLDAHRVLVDAGDRLGNLAQIRSLDAAGFDGPFSFEPFSPFVHVLSDPRTALAASMNYVSAST